MITVFWISAFLLFHTYFGYALSAWLLLRLQRSPKIPTDKVDELPRVAFIIPAYNEAAVIMEKCRNTSALDYPADRLEIMVVADGSSDATPALAALCPGIKVYHEPKRSGKAAALNRAVRLAGACDVLVFSDSNTLLRPDALKNMMRHYSDPATGGVSGEKRVASPVGHPVHGEGIYWKYESFMKMLDSHLYSLVAAAGELFSLRRELWQPIPEDTILDDLYLTLSVCLRGWRFRYEPMAVASELPSPSIDDERERKIRIAAGAFQSFFRFRDMWWPIGHIRLWYIYFSRKVFRWIVSPICLMLLLMSNVCILYAQGFQHSCYQISLYSQFLCYTSALIGWVSIRFGRRAPWLFHVCFYFVFMHFVMVQGLFRYLSGRQSVNWIKSARH